MEDMDTPAVSARKDTCATDDVTITNTIDASPSAEGEVLVNEHVDATTTPQDSVLKCSTSNRHINGVLLCAVVPPFLVYDVLFSYMGYGVWAFTALWTSSGVIAYPVLALFLVSFILFSFFKGLAKWRRSIFLIMLLLATLIGIMWVRSYPHLPFITMYIHLIIYIFYARAVVLKNVEAYRFYYAVALVCTAVAIISFIVWALWLFTPFIDNRTNTWNPENYDWHMNSMKDIFDMEKVTIEECNAEKVSDSCKLIRRSNVILWFGPLCMSLLALFMSIFCYLRSVSVSEKALKSGKEKALTKNNFIVKMFGAAVFIAVAGVWVAASTAGSSIQFSTTLQSTFVVIALALCAWVIREFNINSFEKASLEIPILKEIFRVAPWDSVRGFCLCIMLLPFMVVTIFNFLKQQILTIVGCTTKKGFHLFTNEFTTLVRPMALWRWTAILEWAHLWSWLYIIMSILVMRLCTVFFSFVNETVGGWLIEEVVAIFFAVGLFMFLLPPVPGVPVYLLGGNLITNRLLKDVADDEIESTFANAVLLATLVGILMKLVACALQMLIGVALGSNVTVRLVVGVHMVPMRAFEVILKQPGLNLPKISVLIGGPDWPTSVLCGILRLNVFQMLLGTTPVVLLIAPTCFAAACLARKDPTGMWAAIGTAATVVAAFFQSLSMLVALYYGKKVVSSQGEELAKERPEHADVVAEAKNAERRKIIYDEVTSWNVLPMVPKLLIIMVTILNSFVTWGNVFFSDSHAWRTFNLHEVNPPFVKGALVKNWLLLAKPFGFVILVAMILSLVGYFMYYFHVKHLVNSAIKSGRFPHHDGSTRRQTIGIMTFEELEEMESLRRVAMSVSLETTMATSDVEGKDLEVEGKEAEKISNGVTDPEDADYKVGEGDDFCEHALGEIRKIPPPRDSLSRGLKQGFSKGDTDILPGTGGKSDGDEENPPSRGADYDGKKTQHDKLEKTTTHLRANDEIPHTVLNFN